MQIQQNASLTALNTLGIEARTRYLISTDSALSLPALIQDSGLQDLPRMILGGGSNILFVEDFPGVLVQLRSRGIEIVGEDDDAIYVRAQAGESWHGLVHQTIAMGYAGLENLSLIPGQVGAAPVQNIGAYGVELAQVFHRLEVLDLGSGEIREMDAEACRFGYRDSFFKHQPTGQYLITTVTLRLPRQPVWTLGYGELAEMVERQPEPWSARLISDAVCTIRRRKLPDPAKLGNAGSFFKNPVLSAVQVEALCEKAPAAPLYETGQHYKLPAAWLIEQCGWKGKRRGQAGVSADHALILVNHGGASGQEIWALACDIIESVAQRFGIVLEPEPRIPGVNIAL
jgi:UDP-N-acetylmuramate dehydrogenase